MVLESVLTELSLPESLAEGIEQFAGIHRFRGYKNLRESLQPMLDEYTKYWGEVPRQGRKPRVYPSGSAVAIKVLIRKWAYCWRCDLLYAKLNWYNFLKSEDQPGCPRLLWRHVRVRWD